MKQKIVVVGSSNTDLVVKVDRLPRAGETVIGGVFIKAAGGKGANQAVAAARAGGDVTFVGKVGSDGFGKEAVAGLRREGINVEYVYKEKKAASGVALICVDKNGENCIAVAPGANANLSPRDIKRAKGAFKGGRLRLCSLRYRLRRWLRLLRFAQR